MGGDCTSEQIIVSKVSEAFTHYHLPKYSLSPLKGMLLKSLDKMPVIRLKLHIRCEDNGNIISKISIGRDFATTIDREIEVHRLSVDWQTIDNCIETYFESIGYNGTSCQTNEEIIKFVERLREDIPIINQYIIIEDED